MEILLVGKDKETKDALSFENHEVREASKAEKISAESFSKADIAIVSGPLTRSTSGLADAVAHLKELGDTPVIVLAEFKNAREATKGTAGALKAGAETVISRPVKFVELEAIILRVTSGRGVQPHKFGDQLHAIRTGLGLSRSDLAQILDYSQKSIQDWEEHRSTPRRDMSILNELASLADRLRNQFPVTEIRRWMNAPNRLFGMKSPVELLKQGDLKAIVTALEWIEDGAHS